MEGQVTPDLQVLLIEPNPQEADLYTDIIKSVGNLKIDVISRLGSNTEWLGPSHYHLIIVDKDALATYHNQGKFDCLAILEKIKRSNPETGVIFLASEGQVHEAVAAIRMGAEDYLNKPFTPEALSLAVKRGLDRKVVFGDHSSASSYWYLLNSCQMISATLEQPKIFASVRSFFYSELHSKYSVIYTLHNGEPIRVDESSQEKSPDEAMDEIIGIAVHATSPFQSMIENNETYRFIDKGQLTPGLFIFRFKCASEAEYFCVCLSPRKPAMLDNLESRLHLLRRQIEVTGNNIKQYLGVQQLVYVDDVTGLYNTRYLNNILDREILSADKKGTSFAVLFVDIDHFKKVNDQFGHLIGSRILSELGKKVKKYVRETDTVFRYGGDEFVAVLSDCDIDTAKAVAERVRSQIEKSVFLKREGLKIQVTVSIGIAIFPQHAKSKKTIVELADKAMYEAKKRARNSVRIFASKAS